jgi:hypothetical protein
MRSASRFSPCPELREILLDAYAPCKCFQHLGGPCEARWSPTAGHIPRGFIGATGKIEEVQLVLIAAEPGNPLSTESYVSSDPDAYLDEVCERKISYLKNPNSDDGFSRNFRKVLDMCWESNSLEDQLKRVWLTDSYLCSAKKESGSVATASWRACAEVYLRRQLLLFQQRTNCLFVACGGKAQERVSRTLAHDGISLRPMLFVPALARQGFHRRSLIWDSWIDIPARLP